MPIRWEHQKNIYYPLVFCDECGSRIADAKSANCEYKITKESGIPVNGGHPYFVHKKCSKSFEYQLRDSLTYWHSEELSVFLYFLVHNTKTDLESAKQTADLLDHIS